jgi:hypothetical protein
VAGVGPAALLSPPDPPSMRFFISLSLLLLGLTVATAWRFHARRTAGGIATTDHAASGENTSPPADAEVERAPRPGAPPPRFVAAGELFPDSPENQIPSGSPPAVERPPTGDEPMTPAQRAARDERSRRQADERFEGQVASFAQALALSEGETARLSDVMHVSRDASAQLRQRTATGQLAREQLGPEVEQLRQTTQAQLETLLGLERVRKLRGLERQARLDGMGRPARRPALR